MKRSTPQTRWPLLIILIVATIITYLGFKYLSPKPKSAGIFLVAPTNLTYGDTTIEGILTKDSPASVKGTFLVVLPDSRPVVLDAPGLDGMIGNSVVVSGKLVPADDIFPMMMFVKTIHVK